MLWPCSKGLCNGIYLFDLIRNVDVFAMYLPLLSHVNTMSFSKSYHVHTHIHQSFYCYSLVFLSCFRVSKLMH